jgi:UDP-hydrolysing UDP-N-acetyl-D-glucosamine 2-epimerase
MSSKARRICVVTGTRAEYGLLYWLLRALQADPDVELQIVATGMHLSPEFGLTYRVIEQDGFSITAKVRMLLSDDTGIGMAKSTGLGVMGLADAFDHCHPEIVVLLGDRFESLSAAQAAMCMRIPIAHLHGGETTEGAIDDAVRHSITKMAHLHFVAAETYRRRVIQLGEAPERVYNFGSPGLDHLSRMEWMSRSQLEKCLSMQLGSPLLLATYHPVTLENDSASAMRRLLAALDAFPDANIVLTYSNADAEGRKLNQLVEQYAATKRGRVRAFASLGQQRYLSLMRVCDVVIGNSSSGLTEAPALKKATVNVGDRQRGRLKATSVLDCPEETAAIVSAIRTVLSEDFRARLPATRSLYGEGDASVAIADVLKRVPLGGLLRKQFHTV